MTTKERRQLEFTRTLLGQAVAALTGMDRSWGMALERISDAEENVDKLLEAKPRAKKDKPDG